MRFLLLRTLPERFLEAARPNLMLFEAEQTVFLHCATVIPTKSVQICPECIILCVEVRINGFTLQISASWLSWVHKAAQSTWRNATSRFETIICRFYTLGRLYKAHMDVRGLCEFEESQESAKDAWWTPKICLIPPIAKVG